MNVSKPRSSREACVLVERLRDGERHDEHAGVAGSDAVAEGSWPW
jgi:hypothetical protein